MEQPGTTTSIDEPDAPAGAEREQSAIEQAQAKASELTEQAQDKAQQAARQAKGRLREQVDQRSRQAAEQITSRPPTCTRCRTRCARRARTVPQTRPAGSRSTPRRSAATCARRIRTRCWQTRRTLPRPALGARRRRAGAGIRSREVAQSIEQLALLGAHRPGPTAAASAGAQLATSARHGRATGAGDGAARFAADAAGRTRSGGVAMEPDPRPREESMGELFKQLSNDLATLVRQELRLAQVEMTEKGKRAGLGAGLMSGAGFLAMLAAGVLTACVVAALATGMAVWLAALIVAAVCAAGAAVLALVGRKRVAEATRPVPEQTAESVKEDVQWAKTRMPSARR